MEFSKIKNFILFVSIARTTLEDPSAGPKMNSSENIPPKNSTETLAESVFDKFNSTASNMFDYLAVYILAFVNFMVDSFYSFVEFLQINPSIFGCFLILTSLALLIASSYFFTHKPKKVIHAKILSRITFIHIVFILLKAVLSAILLHYNTFSDKSLSLLGYSINFNNLICFLTIFDTIIFIVLNNLNISANNSLNLVVYDFNKPYIFSLSLTHSVLYSAFVYYLLNLGVVNYNINQIYLVISLFLIAISGLSIITNLIKSLIYTDFSGKNGKKKQQANDMKTVKKLLSSTVFVPDGA